MSYPGPSVDDCLISATTLGGLSLPEDGVVWNSDLPSIVDEGGLEVTKITEMNGEMPNLQNGASMFASGPLV